MSQGQKCAEVFMVLIFQLLFFFSDEVLGGYYVYWHSPTVVRAIKLITFLTKTSKQHGSTSAFLPERPNHTEDFPNVLINHHRLATARFFKPLSYFDNLASSVPATSKLSNDNIASACELHVCPWSTRHMATRGGNLSREGRLCD